MKNQLFKFFLLLSVFAIVVSCTEDDTDSPQDDFDRSAMLSNWADNYVLPGFADVTVKVQEMEASAQAFVSDPTIASLESFRESYKTANLAYQRVAFIGTGPVEQSDFVLQVNTYPTDGPDLMQKASSGNYNLDLPASRDIKGFPALDYLLYKDGDQATLQRYQSSTVQQYALDVVTDIKIRTEAVNQDWQAYRDDFVDRDGSSVNASTDQMVNDFIYYYEKFLRAGKLGIPLGVFSGNEQPQTVESFHHSTFSKALALESLQAHQDFFNGLGYANRADGAGLDDYLDQIEEGCDCEKLSDIINDQFDSAYQSVSTLNNFREEIEQAGPATNMLEAYEELQQLVPLFKVDMVQNLNIAIDYVDADGD